MTVPRARCLALFAAALVVGAAAPARAALPLTLTWDAPAGCPSADVVRAELERLVRFPAGRAPPALVAEGHIESHEGRWRLRLRTERDGLPGERELEADSCGSLARAATLMMALAFGVGAEVAAPPPVEERPARPAPRPRVAEPTSPPAPPPPEPPPPPAAPPPAPIVVVVAPAPLPRAATVWSLVAETRLSDGPVPGLGVGAAVGADARSGRVVASLRLATWLPTDDVTPGFAARMQFSGGGLALSLCAIAAELGRFTLAGCADAGAAALVGTSSGGLTQTSRTAPWYGAGLALRARLRVAGRLHLEARCGGDISLTRPRFALAVGNDPSTVFTVRAVVPVATLGLSLDL